MIRILITGDFCPNKRIEQLVLNKNYAEIYNDFLPNLSGNDINITNLECPLINKDSPIQKFGPNLRAREECVDALTFGNFNLVTMSNNHIMDHGENGLLSTINLCKSNSVYPIGAGRNLEEASKIKIVEIKNKKISFLNFSEIEFGTAEKEKAGSNPLSLVKNYNDIKSAREKADFVIVIVHGGHEGYSLPSPRMVETYRFFIDAGADVVVGHHTHCFSGYESYKNGNIFYSLGNFIFDRATRTTSDWNYGYAIKLILDKDKVNYNLIPYRQCDKTPGVVLLKDAERSNFYEKIAGLNRIINDSTTLDKEWERFSLTKRNSLLINFECCDSSIYRFLRLRKLLPALISEKKKMRLLNLIRCESWRDLSLESLKPKTRNTK